jgi:hypothetical protein
MRLALLLLTACSGGVPVVDEPKAESCSEELSWAHTGQAFMLNYCTGCHSSHLVASERFGAPSGTDFDSLEGVQASLERVRERTLESRDMPPGGGPSVAELTQLEAWLECGAPGEENPLPDTSAFPTGLTGYELRAMVTEESSGLLTVVRELQDFGFGLPNGTYSVEAYELDGEDAWFHGYWIYGSNDEVEREVWWDPPLHLQGDSVDSSQSVEAIVSIDGDSEIEDQEWSWTREIVIGGGLEQDASPTEIVLSEAGGEFQLWHLSDDRGITARQFQIEDGRAWDFLQQSTDISLPEGLAFPIELGANWLERLVLDKGGSP